MAEYSVTHTIASTTASPLMILPGASLDLSTPMPVADKVWLASGTIKRITIDTAVADTAFTVAIYDSVDDESKPFYHYTEGTPSPVARYTGVGKSTPTFEVRDGKLPAAFDANGKRWEIKRAYNATEDTPLSFEVCVPCIHGMGVYLTWDAALTADAAVSIVYCPDVLGSTRFKLSQYAHITF